MTIDRKPAETRRQGISMIEVVISIALVATMMLVTMQASTSVLQMQQEKRDAVFAATLIDLYATEITSMDVRDRVDPVYGLEMGESNRNSYDDMDDYHGQSFAPPTYRDGQAIAGASDWVVTVYVNPADDDGNLLSTAAADQAPLRQIQLVCQTPRGIIFSETLWASEVPMNIDPTVSFQRMRTTTLRFENNIDVRRVVPMRNMPEVNSWE